MLSCESIQQVAALSLQLQDAEIDIHSFAAPRRFCGGATRNTQGRPFNISSKRSPPRSSHVDLRQKREISRSIEIRYHEKRPRHTPRSSFLVTSPAHVLAALAHSIDPLLCCYPTKMKLAIASLLVGSAAAFAPAQEAFRAPTSLQATATDAKVRRENLAAVEQSRANDVRWRGKKMTWMLPCMFRGAADYPRVLRLRKTVQTQSRHEIVALWIAKCTGRCNVLCALLARNRSWNRCVTSIPSIFCCG